MQKKQSTSRPYASRRRQVQAAETRRQVLEAAGRMFTAKGYSGTTIAAIAREAAVSAETVYAVFGTKRTLLAELIGVAVVGEGGAPLLLQGEGPQAVLRSKSQEEQVRMFCAQMAQIMARVGPLFEVMHAAAAAEPDISELLGRVLEQRLEGMRHFVRALSANGPLRAGLDARSAAESVWALSSAELHWLLTVQRKWPAARYQQWLAGVLGAVLLPQGGSARR
jgi:AcrR family transcriptional regulator